MRSAHLAAQSLTASVRNRFLERAYSALARPLTTLHRFSLKPALWLPRNHCMYPAAVTCFRAVLGPRSTRVSFDQLCSSLLSMVKYTGSGGASALRSNSMHRIFAAWSAIEIPISHSHQPAIAPAPRSLWVNGTPGSLALE